MKKSIILCLALMLLPATIQAARKTRARQQSDPQKVLKDKLNRYLASYSKPGQVIRSSARLQALTSTTRCAPSSWNQTATSESRPSPRKA